MLDSSEIKYLTPEQAGRMRAFEILFATDGWKLFTEIAKQNYEQSKIAMLQAEDWPTNRVCAGRLSVLGEILQFEDGTENEFQQLVEAAKAEAEEEQVTGELDFE